MAATETVANSPYLHLFRRYLRQHGLPQWQQHCQHGKHSI